MDAKKKIVDFTRRNYSGVLAKRFERLIDNYTSIDAFFDASKGSIASQYNKTMVKGKGKYSLGGKFWRVFDDVRRFYKSGCGEQNLALLPEEKKPATQNKAVERMFTVEELKAVVAMMELCDISQINLGKIIDLLGAVRLGPINGPVVNKENENAVQ